MFNGLYLPFEEAKHNADVREANFNSKQFEKTTKFGQVGSKCDMDNNANVEFT